MSEKLKIKVRKFHIQPTRSFEIAPQREEYDSDVEHFRACDKYAEEWRNEYGCCDTNCINPDCPQHHPFL